MSPNTILDPHQLASGADTPHPGRRSVASRATAAETGQPHLSLLGLVALPLGGLLAFALGVAIGIRPDHVPVLALSIVMGLLALAPAVVEQARPPRERHILIILIALSWGLFFAAGGVTQYIMLGGYNGDPRGTLVINNLPADVVRGQLTLILALSTLLLAYASPLGRIVASGLPRPRREWTHPAAIGVALVMIPLGWAIYLASQFGLVPKALGTGVMGSLAANTVFGIALLTLAYIRYRSRIALVLLLATIPPTMIFNFFTGSKGLFFAPLAVVVLTQVVVRRRIPLRWVAVGAVAFSLFYPVAQFYREVVQEGNTLRAVQVLENPRAALNRMATFASSFEFEDYFTQGIQMTTGRFTGLGVTSTIVRDTPERVPYQGGWTIGYAFLSLVPRALWPGKPDTSIGSWVQDHYGSHYLIRSHTGPSWTGNLFFEFGYAGVVLGMFALGVYFRILHSLFFDPNGPLPALWLGVILIYGLAPGLGGSLDTPIVVVPFYGGMIYLIHLVVRQLGGTRAAAAVRAPTPPRGAPADP